MHGKNPLSIHRLFALSGLNLNSTHLKRIANLALNSTDFECASTNSTETHRSNEALEGRYSSILQDCRDASSVRHGQQVHAQIVVTGIGHSGLTGTRVLGMYVLCGNFLDARNVFLCVEKGHSLPWNWMIRGFTMLGHFKFALLFYFHMLGLGILPDKYTFTYIIKSCCGLSAVKLGRSIHEYLFSTGIELDVFVASSLIKMYAENGCLNDARQVFDRMSQRDCVLWNAMFDGYAKNGDLGEAVDMFSRMRNSEVRPNSVTFVCILSMCASEAKVQFGMQLHGMTIKFGFDGEASVANTLLAMYSRCRHFSDARKLFDTMPRTDLVTWNCLISGYVQNGYKDVALDLFYKMQSSSIKPDSVTFASFLPSFADSADLKQGKEIHAYIVRNGVCLDAFVTSALIDIYFKCRNVEMASKVFDRTVKLDIVIYSAMISGYVLNGLSQYALEMFRQLIRKKVKPNSVTLASLLPACSSLVTLRLGKELHGYIYKNALECKCFVGSSLTDMYSKCGRLDLGRKVFETLPERDAVAWNTIITSCCQSGQPEEAVKHFRQMSLKGIKLDYVTISSVLSACAALPALSYGKEIHGFMIKGVLRSDIFAESALIDMYAKCGELVFARHVFDFMEEKNEVSWNSMISAYGIHGHVKNALSLFQEMVEMGIEPDHITFLTIISACSHGGLVDEGFRYFHSMSEEYGIVARMEHYACIVDLFGRSGRLVEALNFIKSMPLEPDAGIWGALLGASRVHRNVELAEMASQHLFELDPCNSGYYVLLSNVHAVAGRWESVLRVRSLMKERGVQKLPGCSWIEINHTNHLFVAEDRSHLDTAQIYLFLDSLLLELRELGYVPKPDLMYQ